MTDPDPREAMRRLAREVLGELVPEVLIATRERAPRNGDANGNGHAHGHGHAREGDERETVPQVPPPPVAAILRPSTWSGPAVPGEVIGDGADPRSRGERVPCMPGSQAARVETVKLNTDEDLARFVRELLVRLEHPREGSAIRTGLLRFTLEQPARDRAAPRADHVRTRHAPSGHTQSDSAGTGVVRIAKGAVTERTVQNAAAQGARLVLASGAVLTPLARERARALSVEIEKEARC